MFCKTNPAWNAVKEPLRSDLLAMTAFSSYMLQKGDIPAPSHSAYLDAMDELKKLESALFGVAVSKLSDSMRVSIERRLREKLQSAGIPDGSAIWERAWKHHLAIAVFEAWGLRLG